MGCLYYIPARRFPEGVVPETLKGDLATYGLGHLAGARLSFRGVLNRGPDGGRGLCVGLKTPTSETGIFPGEQTWRVAEGGDLWLGWPSAQGPPGPAVFARDGISETRYHCVLGDGHTWTWTPSSALPKVLSYDDAGETCRLPRESDAGHFEASDWLFEFLAAMAAGEGVPEVTYEDIYGRLTVCLAARYHVSMVEGLVLGLWHDDTYQQALFAALGIDTKKNGEVSG